MLCSIFQADDDEAVEEGVNHFLQENPQAEIKFVTQSESLAGRPEARGEAPYYRLTISLFYTEAGK